MAAKAAAPELPIRIIKVGTCSTLSQRSTLTFHLGSDADGGIHIRVVQNSGNGQFNADWESLSVIEKLLSAHPAEKPMTSRVMQPVFRSKSSNSPAFLFAALLAEGLIKAGTEDSVYLLGDIEPFRQSAAALIASDTDLGTSKDTSPESPKKKRPAKEAGIATPEAA